MKRYLTTLFLFGFSLSVFAAQETYSLSFFSAPAPGWSKDRLVGEVLKNNTGFVIFDKTPDALPFDDAETFKIDTPMALPYGNKTLSIDVVVDPNIDPLWENRLIQFQINGAEVSAAKLDSGEYQFEKLYGDDGKGFVPAVSGTYVFEIDKTLTDLQFISFMTAGAARFNMTVQNVTINAWPEEDVRPRPYLIRFNRLGYLKNQPQPVVLEWQDDLPSKQLPFTVSLSSGTKTTSLLDRGGKNPSSGLDVNAFDLGIDSTTFTTLIVPETVKRTKHTTAIFQVRDSLSEYKKMRNEALGAFHWFDMETYEGAHQQDKVANIFGSTETKDVYGGWYDAGDYGRYSVNGAFSVYLLLMSYVANESAFDLEISPLNERLDQRQDILELVLTELLFLEKMQRTDGAIYHKVNSRDWPNINTAPIDDKDEKFIMPISTTATADVAAVMNLAAFVFDRSELPEDKALAGRFSSVAMKASQFLEENPDLIMIEDKYDGYEYGGPYSDKSDRDERLLASISRAWLNRKIVESDRKKILALASIDRFSDPSPDWMNVNFLSVFSALLISQHDDSLFHEQLKKEVFKHFDALILKQKTNPYGLIYAGDGDAFNWGSNGIIATLGSQFLWLHALTDNSEYWDAAYNMSHWFFGLNPHGIIFATGSSRYNAKRPHFRPLLSQAAPNPNGLLVGGPNSVELKGDIAASPLFKKAPMQVYIDHQDSWATNEVAINWQAAWASYLSLLTAAE
jgi:endoglucanase